MISVEQVRALEERVEKAVSYIATLKSENAALRRELEASKGEVGLASARILELEEAAEAFKRDQVGIEEGIMHALRKLDAFEDLVLKVGQLQGRPEPEAPHAQAVKVAMETPTASARPSPVPKPSAPVPEASPVVQPIQAEAPLAEAPLAEAPLAEAPLAEPEGGKTADELSLEELEAATAPSPAPVENELDIF